MDNRISSVKKVSSDEDLRGEIYDLGVDANVHVSLLTTKKGYVRGGHSHKYNEEFFVVIGKLEYHSGFEDNEQVSVFGPGSTVRTSQGIPHYIKALDDLVLVEFRPRDSEYEAIEYQPFRRLVKMS